MVINYGMFLVGGLLTEESRISGEGSVTLFYIFMVTCVFISIFSIIKNNEVNSFSQKLIGIGLARIHLLVG